jgi:hypothetical protein
MTLRQTVLDSKQKRLMKTLAGSSSSGIRVRRGRQTTLAPSPAWRSGDRDGVQRHAGPALTSLDSVEENLETRRWFRPAWTVLPARRFAATRQCAPKGLH